MGRYSRIRDHRDTIADDLDREKRGIVTALAGDRRTLLLPEELNLVGGIWGPEIKSPSQLTAEQIRHALDHGERLGELGQAL